MRSIAILLFVCLVPLAIGVLAATGIRKARAMSRAHIASVMQSGQAERLVRPKTKEDYFLRSMSLRDVCLAVLGAALFTSAVHVISLLLR
jgi:hypothetical protein